jgi:lysophospholipase L1-like esterase
MATTAHRAGKTRGRWRIVALLAVAALAASEIGLRLLTDRDSKWNIRLGTALVFDPVCRFRFAPNHRLGEGVYTNERGFLAPPGMRLEKPRDRLRLIYVGDSVTVLPIPGFYPAQVEGLLAARGIPVETLDAAVPGHATDNARALFESEVSRFDGDWLFVALGWNDLGQYGPEGLPYKRMRVGYHLNPVEELLTHVYTLRLGYAVGDFVRHWQSSVYRPLSPSDQQVYERYYPQHYEDNLRAILALAKQRYPHVAVMNLATLTNDDPTPSELARAHYPTGMDRNMRKLDLLVRRYNEVVAAVAAEQHVEVVDLFGLFDDHASRASFTDSCHLDRNGAARIAAVIADRVASEGSP